MKHTPGPWVITEGSYGHYVGIRGGGKTIARVVWGNGDTPNARLIAAAPDLLAAASLTARTIGKILWRIANGEKIDLGLEAERLPLEEAANILQDAFSKAGY